MAMRHWHGICMFLQAHPFKFTMAPNTKKASAKGKTITKKATAKATALRSSLNTVSREALRAASKAASRAASSRPTSSKATSPAPSLSGSSSHHVMITDEEDETPSHIGSALDISHNAIICDA